MAANTPLPWQVKLRVRLLNRERHFSEQNHQEAEKKGKAITREMSRQIASSVANEQELRISPSAWRER